MLDNGFADLSPFFRLAPWIFTFLIPAVTMKSFAEEKKEGTMELLLTRPIGIKNLIAGKFLGTFILVLLALVPSILYVTTLYQLGDPVGNLDLGVTLASYLGLILLAACYTSIGLFSSSITNNQITAFIVAVFLCFLCFFAFEGIGIYKLFGNSSYGIEYLGINYHYKSMGRGVIDTRDVIYFLSLIALFIYLSYVNISQTKISRS